MKLLSFGQFLVEKPHPRVFKTPLVYQYVGERNGVKYGAPLVAFKPVPDQPDRFVRVKDPSQVNPARFQLEK